MPSFKPSDIPGVASHFDAAKLPHADGDHVVFMPFGSGRVLSTAEQAATDEHMRQQYGAAVPDIFPT